MHSSVELSLQQITERIHSEHQKIDTDQGHEVDYRAAGGEEMVAEEMDERHRTGQEVKVGVRNGRVGLDHAVDHQRMKRNLIGQDHTVNAQLVEVGLLGELLGGHPVQMVVPTQLVEVGHEEKVQTAHPLRLPIQVAPIAVDPADRQMNVEHTDEEELLQLGVDDVHIDQIELQLRGRQNDGQHLDAAEKLDKTGQIV